MHKFTEFRMLVASFLTLGIAGWLSAGMGLYGLMNGGQQQPGAGSGASSSTGALQTISPQMLQAFQQLMQVDPSGYLQGAQGAGTQYGEQANLDRIYQQIMGNQYQTSAGAQQNLMGAGDQLWKTAQDPQNGLYNQMLQQTQDQSRNASSVRGIGMSPEAAGLENQATNQFNLGWQNNQLARQTQGLQGMTGAYQGAGQQGALAGANLSAAGQFGSQIPQNTMQGGQVPYQAQQTAYGAPMGYANQYSTALNTAFNPSLANYNMQGTNFNANQQQMGGQAIGQGLQYSQNQPGSWLNGMFSGGGSQSPYYSGGSGGSSWTSGFDLPMG